MIASSGDISMKAATTEMGTISTLWNVGFTNLQNTAWSVSGTAQAPSYNVSGEVEVGDNGQYFNIYSAQDKSNVELESRSFQTDSSTNTLTETFVNIQCYLIDPLALQVNVDAARAAKNLGSAAGVDTFDDNAVSGRIEGGKAFWIDSTAMSQFCNLRFDLATGELASSSSTIGTYSPLSLSLPTGEREFGSYSETLNRNDEFYSFKDAKGVCLNRIDYNAETSFSVNATAYGNRFYPVPGRIRSISPEAVNEAPLESRGSFCNNKFDFP